MCGCRRNDIKMSADHKEPANIIFRRLVDIACYDNKPEAGGDVYPLITTTFADLVDYTNKKLNRTNAYINQTIMLPLGLIKYAIYKDYTLKYRAGKRSRIIPQITYLVVNAPSMPNAGLAPPPAHYEDIATPAAEQHKIWSAIYAFDWTGDVVDGITDYIMSGVPMLQRGTGMPDYPDAAGRPELSPDTRHGHW